MSLKIGNTTISGNNNNIVISTLSTGGTLTTEYFGTTTVKRWEGTEAQWDAGRTASLIDDTVLCTITDDVTSITTADIAPSTDRNYVTNTQLAVLQSTSGTNTGDETQSSIITKIGYTPANDTSVLHLAGAETISGAKTFSSASNILYGNGANITNLSPKNLVSTNSTHFVCNNTSTQSLSAGVYTKLLFPNKWSDGLNEWNTSTSRFTPSFSQTILLTPDIYLSSSSSTFLNIRQDGNDYVTFALSSGQAILTSFPYYFPSGHYYEFYLQSNVANTINIYSAFFFYTFFGG